MDTNTSTSLLNTCVFSNNLSGDSGGAMTNFGGTLELMDTRVCGNTDSQILNEYTDFGGNCIQEFCIDCDGPDCPADLNDDGIVNSVDLTILIADWGCTGEDCPGDIDGSGLVDGADITIILSNWGGCP